MPILLSRAAQQQGQKTFTKATKLNPFGSAFSLGPLIYLLALHYDATDMQMSLLYASPFIMSFMALFVPILLGGMDTSNIMSRFWFLRAFTSIGYFTLPFFAATNNDIKVWIVIICCYGFTTFRALAITAWPSVLRGLTPPKEVRAMTATTHSAWYFATLFTSTMSFLCLRYKELWPSEESVYISILAFGFIINLITSWIFSKIPETGKLQKSSISSLMTTAKTVWTNRKYKEVLLLTVPQIAFSILIAYQMNYLKKVLEFGSDSILFITLASTVTSLIITKIVKITGNRVTSRILLSSSNGLLIIFCLLWAFIGFIPESIIDTTAGILYIITIMMMTLSITIRAAISAERLPPDNQVQTSIIYQISGAIGSLLGIGLAWMATNVYNIEHLNGMHAYSGIFLIATVMCVILTLISVFMRPERNLTILQEFSQLAPSNLKTIFSIHKIQEKEGKRLLNARAMEGLMSVKTQAGRDLIIESLQSIEMLPRMSAIRSLNVTPLPEAYKYILKEAASYDSPLRCEAITCLGLLQNNDAIPSLYKWLKHPSQRIQSNSIKSLLRLGEIIKDEKLFKFYTETIDSRLRLDILYGILSQKNIELLLKILSWELKKETDPVWLRSIFLTIGDCLNERILMIDTLTDEKNIPGNGLKSIINELKENPNSKDINLEKVHRQIAIGEYDYANDVFKLKDDIKISCITSAIGILVLWHIGIETEE